MNPADFSLHKSIVNRCQNARRVCSPILSGRQPISCKPYTERRYYSDLGTLLESPHDFSIRVFLSVFFLFVFFLFVCLFVFFFGGGRVQKRCFVTLRATPMLHNRET